MYMCVGFTSSVYRNTPWREEKKKKSPFTIQPNGELNRAVESSQQGLFELEQWLIA